jgi:hypothetical protein
LFEIPVVFRGVIRMSSISWAFDGEKAHLPAQKSSQGLDFFVKGLGGYCLGSLQLPTASACGSKQNTMKTGRRIGQLLYPDKSQWGYFLFFIFDPAEQGSCPSTLPAQGIFSLG